jgi:hypothetical protein
MNWEADGPASRVCGEWRVTKYKVLEAFKYRLFRGEKPVGLFNSFAEAKDAIDATSSEIPGMHQPKGL